MAYIAWDDDHPAWDHYVITLDGNFTKEELLAILFFHPDNQPKE